MYYLLLHLLCVGFLYLLIRIFAGRLTVIPNSRHIFVQPPLPLKYHLLNRVGIIIKFLFNINLFGTYNFKWLKQKAIKSNEQDLGYVLDDFGDQMEMNLFEEAFEQGRKGWLVDPFISTVGWFSRRVWLVKALKERLRIVDDLKHHPEIREIEIRAPLIILGLPRTGTTLLYNLLAQDPFACYPRLWQCLNPSLSRQHKKSSVTDTTTNDPRLPEEIDFLATTKLTIPTIDQTHYLNVELPEECSFLFKNMLIDVNAGVTSGLFGSSASFIKFISDQSSRMDSYYRYHRLLIQFLIYKSQRKISHVLLKSAAHSLCIQSLLKTYPDARLIQTHRDPLKVIPSFSSLYLQVRSVLANCVSLEDLGQKSLKTCANLIDSIMEQRETTKSPQQFFDLHYHQLIQDPINCIRQIYSYYQLTYTNEFEAKMLDYLKHNVQGKHGRHDYSLDKFNLCKTEIRQRFRVYQEKFNILRES
ncbi:unnamed protein product [Didymodactylos carnosus]|uniref:Sulfotransferase n=1 Tax=Didymodactylos carnosus TaxID=1234261 RepID=A0A8S2E6X1_9BILA|nr:unnamed protein product [Didymodactylos carnosus]CAF3855365.1 unnamed protein product [Didymodactylos carnosus]